MALHAFWRFKGKKCKPLTEEHKLHISEAKRGKKCKPQTEEHKRHISESLKSKKMSEEIKRKMSAVRQGRSWFNNGIKNIWAFDCPEGFVRGMLKRKAI